MGRQLPPAPRARQVLRHTQCSDNPIGSNYQYGSKFCGAGFNTCTISATEGRFERFGGVAVLRREKFISFQSA